MAAIATFFSSLNFQSLINKLPSNLAQGLIWGVMALGVFITFRMLDFADLTVDGSLATGGVVCVILVLNGWSCEAALVISFLAGSLAGLVTSLLHTVIGIPGILCGILSQSALYSINLIILGAANRALPTLRMTPLFSGFNVADTAWLSLGFCAVLILLLYAYLNTEHGSALRATGVNPRMARAQGINTKVMTIIGLSLSNGLVALCGGMFAQFQGNADIKMGQGAIVIGLAAVIIGEVLGEALFRKHFNLLLRMVFVVVGAIAYYFVYTLVMWLKLPTDYMKLVAAIVIAIFLAVPNLQNARKNSFARLAKENKQKAKEGA